MTSVATASTSAPAPATRTPLWPIALAAVLALPLLRVAAWAKRRRA